MDTLSYALLAIGLCVNLFAYGLMAIDKQKARRNSFRIAEKTLLGLALLGGAWGIWGGMMPPIRHKNRKWYFWVAVLLGILLQAAVAYGLLWLNEFGDSSHTTFLKQ